MGQDGHASSTDASTIKNKMYQCDDPGHLIMPDKFPAAHSPDSPAIRLRNTSHGDKRQPPSFRRRVIHRHRLMKSKSGRNHTEASSADIIHTVPRVRARFTIISRSSGFDNERRTVSQFSSASTATGPPRTPYRHCIPILPGDHTCCHRHSQCHHNHSCSGTSCETDTAGNCSGNRSPV